MPVAYALGRDSYSIGGYGKPAIGATDSAGLGNVFPSIGWKNNLMVPRKPSLSGSPAASVAAIAEDEAHGEKKFTTVVNPAGVRVPANFPSFAPFAKGRANVSLEKQSDLNYVGWRSNDEVSLTYVPLLEKDVSHA